MDRDWTVPVAPVTPKELVVLLLFFPTTKGYQPVNVTLGFSSVFIDFSFYLKTLSRLSIDLPTLCGRMNRAEEDSCLNCPTYLYIIYHRPLLPIENSYELNRVGGAEL